MCGIAGIFAYHYAANAVDRAELIRIRDHMAMRGPDGAGAWFSDDGRLGLAHRRLSIIDLSSAGAQPMLSVDGKLAVTFNGEIYNYQALRKGLEAKGRVFRSNCDTEVLLHLYAEKGEEMVRDLRGMFAFALRDAVAGRLILARDPYGIKPLYFADDGWSFRFASQVKALLAGGKVSRDPEPAGWAGYYIFGSVPEPFTTYQDIRALEAGSTLVVDHIGPHQAKKYFSIAETYRQAEGELRPVNADDIQGGVRDALLDSVRHHLVSDVAVGAFLSAGIDSGALVGLMRDAGQSQIQTITLAFDEFRGRADDEAPIARDVAKIYGARHTTRTVTEREFAHDLPRILDAMDQPTIDGINTWFVSKAAHELGLKVVISGLGGDELFGGYPSYQEIPRWSRWLALPSRVPLLGRTVRGVLAAVCAPLFGLSPKVAGMLELGGTFEGAYLLRRGLFMPWELNQLMDPQVARAGLQRLRPLAGLKDMITPRPKSAFGRVAALESSAYMRNQLLRDTDWASMAHSLEVRVPLVDTMLLRRIAPLSIGHRGVDKRMLASSPSIPVPESVVSRRKTGFQTPVSAWLERTAQVRTYENVRALQSAGCHWSRRWAYNVAAA